MLLRGQLLRRLASRPATTTRRTTPPLVSSEAALQSTKFLLAFGITSSSIVYFSPFFPVTREGIRLAWQWKETSPFDDVVESYAWQFCFGAMGLLTGYQASKQVLIKSMASTGSTFLLPFKLPFMVFCGLLGAKLTIALSQPMTNAMLLVGRLVEYSLGGLLVDVGAQSLYDLDWGHLAKLPAKHDDGNATGAEAEVVKEFKNSGDVLHDLSVVTGSLDDLQRIGAYGHKLLLVKELGRLRTQERVINDKSSTMDAASVSKMLAEIKARKRQVKQLCESVHQVKIGRLYEEIKYDAADKLNLLRQQQVDLVLSGAPKMSELKKLDRDKEQLKRKARLALGVKLSRYAKPNAKWKSLWKDVASNKS